MRSFRRSTYLPKDLASQIYGPTQPFGNTAQARRTYGSKRVEAPTTNIQQSPEVVTPMAQQVTQPAQVMSAAA